MTHERFNRILNWTCDDEVERFSAPRIGVGPQDMGPAPWPVIMTAQRLHWQGRTQEAYDMAARLS